MLKLMYSVVFVVGIWLWGAVPAAADNLNEAVYTKDADSPAETGYVIIQLEGEKGNTVYKRMTEQEYESLVRRTGQSSRNQYTLPPIKLVQKELYRYADPTPVEEGPSSWGTSRIGADMLKSRIGSGAQVTVAVVDSGVDSTHPFLNKRMVPGYDFVNKTTVVVDVNGHGTHVAGIIADATHSNVKIMPVRVLDDEGWGADFNIGQGVRFAADQGADIINMSLGGPGNSPYMRESIDYAISKGVLVVVAAGNDHDDTQNYFPASYDPALVVASSDEDDQLSGFSNYGESVDLTAPGGRIDSSLNGGGYGEMSGTSMASPYAAGAAALLKSENPQLKPDELQDRLLAYTDDLGETGRDPYYGEGILNVGAYRLKTENSSFSLISPRNETALYDKVELKTYTSGHIGEMIQIVWQGQQVAEHRVTKDGLQHLTIPAAALAPGSQRILIRLGGQEIPLTVTIEEYHNYFSVDTLTHLPSQNFSVFIYGIPYADNDSFNTPELLEAVNSIGGRAASRLDIDEIKQHYHSVAATVRSRDKNVPLYVRELSENGDHHFLADDVQKITFSAKLPDDSQADAVYSDIQLSIGDTFLPKLPLFAGPLDEKMEFYADRGNHLALFRGDDFLFHRFTDNQESISLYADSSSMFKYDFKSHSKVGGMEGFLQGDYTYVRLYAKQSGNRYMNVWMNGLDGLSNPMYLTSGAYQAVAEENVKDRKLLSVYKEFSDKTAEQDPVFDYGGPITGGFLLNTKAEGLTGKIDFKDAFGNTLYTNYMGMLELENSYLSSIRPLYDNEMYTEVRLTDKSGQSHSTVVNGDNDFTFFNRVPDGTYTLSFDYQNELFPVSGTHQTVEVKAGRFVSELQQDEKPIILQKTIEAAIEEGSVYSLDLNTVFRASGTNPLNFKSSEGVIRGTMLSVEGKTVGDKRIVLEATVGNSQPVTAELVLNVKEKELPFQSDGKDFEEKFDVPVDKIWTVSVNREYEPDDIRSVELYENGKLKPIEVTYQSAKKNLLILPKNKYERAAKCELRITLKNGKGYRMKFTVLK